MTASPESYPRDLGPWPSDETLELTAYLRRAAKLPGDGTDPPRAEGDSPREPWLAREEFARRHGARPADLERFRAFCERAGLEVGGVSASRRSANVRGTARIIGGLFGVEFRCAGDPARPFRRATGRWSIPSALEPIVRAVVGAESTPRLRPHFRRNPDAAPTGYSPVTVGQAYAFPPNLTGKNVSVGLLEFGGGYSAADLGAYFASLGLTTPEVVTVSVDGGSNAPSGDPNGPDAEVELDLEVAGALAPGARYVVYFAPNTEQGFVDALSTAVHDTAHSPAIVSISWGGPESSWSTAARIAMEDTARDSSQLGVTLLAASGDQGASDGGPPGTRQVDFPASSPYFLGCGGTRLELSGSAVLAETVWDDLATNEGATGGGVSEAFPIPAFQQGAKVPSAPNGFVGRGVPDVAADADPRTGYTVRVDGAPAVIGGTSAAAPLWAALLAKIVEARGAPLGLLQPRLYDPAAASALRAVTRGNNGGYAAGPGWNACTGLGSPIGTQLLELLRS